MNCKIGGRYFLEVLNANGVVVKTAEFENMILDGALTRWSNGNVGFNSGPYFCVGTGTSTPVANQTALDSLLAGSLSGSRATYVVSPTNEDRGSSVYRASTAYTYTYSIGQIVGNISEIGANWAAQSTSNLDSRALFVDAFGDPTTITVLSSEQLRVNYTVYMDINPSQSTATITFDGVSTSCTLEKLNTNNGLNWEIFAAMNNTAALFDSSVYLSSTANLVNSVSTASSSSGMVLHTVSWTVSANGAGVRRHQMTFASGSGNIAGGIKYMMLTRPSSSARHLLGIHFSPNINKTNVKTLTLTFDMVLTRA